ncbi:hypothetical protein PYW08_012618 [Mythimna loreyi]|uniref:Uncharacterized protein n=1 Tax=Mythimna loreyi TaxID=667449 RepID=A0ACC2Q0P2_9NEOP|nr:hypothetical protein PYW08_012618 [Mythimna loreyi]
MMMSYRFKANHKNFTMFNERVIRGMQLFGLVLIGEHERGHWRTLVLPPVDQYLTKLNIPKNNIDKIKINNNEIISDPKCISNIFYSYFVDKIKPVINSEDKVTKHNLNRKDSMFLAPS